MKKCKSLSRILALDLHPGRFGYVVLEDSTELLDWGVRRNYRGPKPWRTVLIQKRLTSLLNQWEPSLVLMNEATRFSPQIRRIVTVIRKEARHRKLMVKLIGRAAVSGTFGEGRPIRKYEIASLLAECFPVLRWELPQRKIWGKRTLPHEHLRCSGLSGGLPQAITPLRETAYFVEYCSGRANGTIRFSRGDRSVIYQQRLSCQSREVLLLVLPQEVFSS